MKRGFIVMAAGVMLLTAGCGKSGTAAPTEAETVEETMAAASLPETTAGEIFKDDTDAAGPMAVQADEQEETSIDRAEIFAEKIQEAVADKNMEALAALLSYPCRIDTGDQERIDIPDMDTFMKQNEDLVFGDDLMTVIANVDTAAITKSQAGYVMGEDTPGIIFQEFPDGMLGIIEINE